MLLFGWLAWALRFDVPLTRPWLENAELRLVDSRFNLRGPRPPADLERIKSQVTIVAMDDAVTRRYGRVLPRDLHARLVTQLKKEGADAVIFDVLFIDPDRRDPASDARFAAAVRAAGNVFLPFDDNSSERTTPAAERALAARLALPGAGARSDEVVRLQPPYPALLRAMRGGGHVATKSDNDSKFRNAILLLENGALYPHVALAAVAQTKWHLQLKDLKLEGHFLRAGDRLIGPLERRSLLRTAPAGQGASPNNGLEDAGAAWMIPLDFLGGRDVMAQLTVPYESALAGAEPGRIKNHIVIVGDYATGTPDLRPGPFDTREVFLGVQTNATLLANLLATDNNGYASGNHFLHPTPRSLELLLTLACGIFAGLIALALRPALSLPLTGALALGIIGVSLWTFGANFLLETTTPLLALALNYTALSAYRLTLSDRDARRHQSALLETQTLLGQIVNPKLAQELASSPATRLALQIGARREMSILFCDIRGFTPWSESQTPEEVKARLDEYFPTMCEICEDDFDGFIDKFIGDAIMVVWNAHKDHPDHAERATRAAISMQRALIGLNDGWKRQGVQEFQIGIGIASGEAIFGTFGAPGRKVAPTVLGDTVNLAARLESASKEYGPILVSRATFEMLGQEFITRFAGEVAIKGKAAPQRVYAIEGVTREKGAAEVEVALSARRVSEC